MRNLRKLLFRVGALSLAGMALSLILFKPITRVEAATPGAAVPTNPTCYPSCVPNDARFFSLAGSSLFTFAGGATTIGLRVKGTSNPTSFVVGIFDGDGGGLWDQDSANVGQGANFVLYADNNSDGNPDGAALDTLPSASMIDNGWSYFTVPTNSLARVGGQGTDYVYQLKVSLVAPFAGLVQNNFKVGADSTQTKLFISPQILSFQAFQNSYAEFLLIHPTGNPDYLTPSNYDGKWSFSFEVTGAQTSIAVWDGDFDIGNVLMGSAVDQDDPSTPNVLPSDASLGALAFSVAGVQGIVVEGNGTTNYCAGPQADQGCPPDDSSSPAFFRLSGTPGAGVVTRLLPPSGQPIVNTNPSGNSEWELFRVAEADAPLPALTDVAVGAITPGLWTYQIQGMDLGNLFALRFDRTLTVEPFVVGDTVFCDSDQDGIQDLGDLGKAGVVVELVGTSNNVIKTTTTDASGTYSFGVEPGTYTVRIAASNFGAQQVLQDLTTTTNYGIANQRTQTVAGSSLLTFDFGYTCTNPQLSQGCSPGFWKQSQHFGNYPTGIYPNTLFVTVFGEDAFPGKTLLEVMNLTGGGLNALGRFIVSAYLNASAVTGFPVTPAQVIADFQAVFPGGDYATISAKYVALQDPCPLSTNPGPTGLTQ